MLDEVRGIEGDGPAPWGELNPKTKTLETHVGSYTENRDRSEVGVNVVLGAAEPCFQRGYERIFADLYQAGGTSAFLGDDGGHRG